MSFSFPRSHSISFRRSNEWKNERKKRKYETHTQQTRRQMQNEINEWTNEQNSLICIATTDCCCRVAAVVSIVVVMSWSLMSPSLLSSFGNAHVVIVIATITELCVWMCISIHSFYICLFSLIRLFLCRFLFLFFFFVAMNVVLVLYVHSNSAWKYANKINSFGSFGRFFDSVLYFLSSFSPVGSFWSIDIDCKLIIETKNFLARKRKTEVQKKCTVKIPNGIEIEKKIHTVKYENNKTIFFFFYFEFEQFCQFVQMCCGVYTNAFFCILYDSNGYLYESDIQPIANAVCSIHSSFVQFSRWFLR